jgi:hypothetical protein
MSKKYFQVLLCFLLIIVSIRPALFVYNYVIARYQVRVLGDFSRASIYELRAINLNPESWKSFKELRESRIKAAIFSNNRKVYNLLSTNEREKCEEKYKNNFYFQYFLNDIDKDKRWQYLDSLSFFFLQDKRYNKLTTSILNKLDTKFELEFLINLCDFLFWQNNVELVDFISGKYNLDRFEYKNPKEAINYQRSILKSKTVILRKFDLGKDPLGENLIQPIGLEDYDTIKEHWDFRAPSKSQMDSSFFIGTEILKGNLTVKLTHLYTYSDNRSKNYGGIKYNKKVNIDSGYYVFSFSYKKKTGEERVYFQLNKVIKTHWLEAKVIDWQQVVFVFDNRDGKIQSLIPSIRMFNRGSLWIDNVFLGKIHAKKLNFNGQSWMKVVNYGVSN